MDKRLVEQYMMNLHLPEENKPEAQHRVIHCWVGVWGGGVGVGLNLNYNKKIIVYNKLGKNENN